MESSSRLSRSRQVAFSLLFIGVILLVCEIAVRARAWIKYGTSGHGVTNDMMVTDPASGLRCLRPGYSQRSQSVSIEINSLGFRGDEISSRKSPRTLRVACLGASTTFCAEVSNNHATWPHRLQEALQQRFPDLTVEVINAGIPGYVASEQVEYLKQRILPLQPDLVIYYEANNDMAVDTRDLARERGLIPATAGHVSAPVKFLADRSLLFDLVSKNAFIALGRRDTNVSRLTSIPPELPARFIGELDKIRTILIGNRIPLVLSTFLVKYRRNQDRAAQIANASISFYYMPWMTIDALLDGMDVYNRAIVEYAKSHDIPVVDDRESIPADAQHYADWAHMTDAGASMMAQRFERFFRTTGIMDGIASAKRGSKEVSVVQ